MWLSACRNLDALKALKDKIVKSSGISRKNEGYRIRENTDSIQLWRATLRRKIYLSRTTQFDGVDGDQLDISLTKFTELARCRRYYQIGHLYLNEEYPSVAPSNRIVFVTPEERKRVDSNSNQNQGALRKEIEKLINNARNRNIRAYFRNRYEHDIPATVASLHHFYMEILSYIGEEQDYSIWQE